MLAETRAELDEFQVSSKELEEELERELERTEKAQQDLQIKVSRAEHEKDDWKSKFMTLQTMHNTTTTSLQRELDTLRKEYQTIKIQLRDLEMGNDDLERNERAISSSLADVEQRYSRVLEEKILLEHELIDKANVEEEFQRLKDEFRDANEEIGVLREQLSAAHDRAPVEIPPSAAPSATSHCSDEEESLTSIPVPPELRLSDLTSPSPTSMKELPRIIGASHTMQHSTPSSSRSPSALHRSGLQRPTLTTSPTSIPPALARSSTIPFTHMTPTRTTPRTPLVKPPPPRNSTAMSTTSSTAGSVAAASTRSKGVQMVSEMRARVKVLEQKIHTRVPRIRMGSVTNRPVASPSAMPPPLPPKAGPSGAASSVASSSNSSLHSQSPDKTVTLKPRRQSLDREVVKSRTPVGDASGWVLIMEDSPSPVRDKEKELRRLSGPTAPSAFRPLTSSSMSPPSSSESRVPSALSQSHMPSGLRRPNSRLSDGRSSISTNATTSTASSIPTPISRPSTPTFLPVPTSGLYASTAGLKRSTGPSSGAYSQPKRSSLGSKEPLLYKPPPKLGSPSRAKRETYSGPTVKKSGDDFSDAQVKQVRGRAGSASLLFGRHGL
ncbi:hypothetical protein PHLCEN_2v8845 [Hermanssonia centrifuga]|uniref:NUDE domain-containing protein n=1 Tax=Hermanssonia centrifuga TaxID=98765 RepID=A0A2R6NSP8_9APHY|nr:hypothetical protein PHLCEN_2v8845 [Hermanssonia centrifuga]